MKRSTMQSVFFFILLRRWPLLTWTYICFRSPANGNTALSSFLRQDCCENFKSTSTFSQTMPFFNSKESDLRCIQPHPNLLVLECTIANKKKCYVLIVLLVCISFQTLFFNHLLFFFLHFAFCSDSMRDIGLIWKFSSFMFRTHCSLSISNIHSLYHSEFSQCNVMATNGVASDLHNN